MSATLKIMFTKRLRKSSLNVSKMYHFRSSFFFNALQDTAKSDGGIGFNYFCLKIWLLKHFFFGAAAAIHRIYQIVNENIVDIPSTHLNDLIWIMINSNMLFWSATCWFQGSHLLNRVLLISLFVEQVAHFCCRFRWPNLHMSVSGFVEPRTAPFSKC